jgi:hypothetical protein
MDQAPSYEKLKDSEYFWLQATPCIAGMNETVDASAQDEPITSFLFYECNVTAINDGHDFPFSRLRIDIDFQKSIFRIFNHTINHA